MLLSIIIINYNTYLLTKECLLSIKKTTKIKHEIILVDNNSKDRHPKDFLNEFPDLKLIELNENVGFGRANNIAMEMAEGDYFLLLNSDTIVNENTIDETFNFMLNNLETDILGCKCKNPNGTDQLTVYKYSNELRLIKTILFFIKKNAIYWFIKSTFYYILNRVRLNNKSEPFIKRNNNENGIIKENIGSILGVYLLLKRNVFEETKGFDPDFFMYYEESEWFLKRLMTYNKVYYPFASIIHYGGKSDIHGYMNKQEKLSEFLFWYKIGLFHYCIFVFFNLVNIPSNFIIGLLTFKKRFFEACKISLLLQHFALFNIPKYPNCYNGRKTMLRFKNEN